MISSAKEFVELCNSAENIDIEKSLKDEATLDIWLELVASYQSHHIDVAQNRTIPPEIMRALALKGDKITREILAEKRSLPFDLFDFLSKDSNSLVRKKIAANSKTPLDIVKFLSNDADEDVARVARYRLIV